MAVVAFACGLAGLCPGVGFAAMIMGFVANLRIVRSRGRLRGRGYALWGLGLGTATTFIWLSAWDMLGTRVLELLEERMEEQVRLVFEAGAEADAPRIRSLMDLSPDSHVAGLSRFVEETKGGGLEPWSISVERPRQVESDGGQPEMLVDLRIDDADGSIWTGTARFDLPAPVVDEFSLESIVYRPRLAGLYLIGPGGRSIRLPGDPPEASPATVTPDGGE